MTPVGPGRATQASFSGARPSGQASSAKSSVSGASATEDPILQALSEQILLIRADPTPLYYQLACGIEKLVQTGRLSSGDRLPAAARLASRFRITPGTVHSALVYLEIRRVVRTDPRPGTYVR